MKEKILGIGFIFLGIPTIVGLVLSLPDFLSVGSLQELQKKYVVLGIPEVDWILVYGGAILSCIIAVLFVRFGWKTYRASQAVSE